MAAHASAEGDATLQAQVDLSKSALKNLRDAELDDRAQAIQDIAAELFASHAAAMSDCGLTAVKLTDLQSAITAYGALVGGPRAAIVGRAAITEAIAAEFARVDLVLNGQLDKLVVQFEAENPQFVSAYRSARLIVASGSRAAGDKPTPPAPKPPLQPA